MKIIAIALLFALSCIGTAHAQTDAYLQAKAKADADEAGLSPEDREALMAAQNLAVEEGVSACATPNPDMSPFVIVAELDGAGRVARTWRDGNTPLAICFQKQVANRLLSKPPRAPFFASFEMSFTP